MEGGNSLFNNETPIDIMNWDIDRVCDLVKDPAWYDGPSPRVRLNFIKKIYEVEGYDLTPDAALALINFNTSMLILATAGSGKTTLVQLKALLMKLILNSKFQKGRKIVGKEILCLVYNTHNVEDIKQKHATIVNRLKAASVHPLDIDDEVHACTMHSFCEFWRKRFIAKLGLLGFTLISGTESVAMMDRSIRLAFKMLKLPENPKVFGKDVLSFYNLCRETMKSPAELTETDKFRDTNATVEVLEKAFERFEVAKNLKKKYDYCDMLERVCGLLERSPEDLAMVQTYYSVIIADEVQDFTPLMWKLLKLFTNNGTPLVCIGDEDQNIYRFKGADVMELLNFSSEFEDGHVYTLNQNRRCRKAILDEALAVIEENTLRFDKKLIGTKEGGKVEFIPYSSEDGQAINVLERIKKMPESEWYRTAVCFRENAGSMLLAELLEENKIPYYSLQDALPFSHEYYRHVFDILNALEMPFDRQASINLYKVLPCSKSKIFEVMGFNVKTHRFNESEGRKHFTQYNYGSLLNVKGFQDALYKLADLSKRLTTEPLKNYVGDIFEMLDKYFWHFKKEQNANDADELFEKRAQKFFSSDLSYSRFFNQYNNRLSVCRRNISSHTGVVLSTFHGLKGLEFENVFVLYMDEDVFPNFHLIESRNYSKDTEINLKESETRLWYVAITRAISNLYVYYSEANPSRYVVDGLERKRGTWIRSKSSPESTVVMAGFDDFDGDFDDESAVDSELEIHESSMTTSAEMDTSDNFGVLEASLDRNNAVSAESHSESTEFDSAIDSVLAAGSTAEACSANPIVLETKESTKSETEQSNVSGMKHSNYLANIIDSFA